MAIPTYLSLLYPTSGACMRVTLFSFRIVCTTSSSGTYELGKLGTTWLLPGYALLDPLTNVSDSCWNLSPQLITPPALHEKEECTMLLLDKNAGATGSITSNAERGVLAYNPKDMGVCNRHTSCL